MLHWFPQVLKERTPLDLTVIWSVYKAQNQEAGSIAGFWHEQLEKVEDRGLLRGGLQVCCQTNLSIRSALRCKDGAPHKFVVPLLPYEGERYLGKQCLEARELARVSLTEDMYSSKEWRVDPFRIIVLPSEFLCLSCQDSLGKLQVGNLSDADVKM